MKKGICCAAALATLNIYEDDNLINKAAAMGQYVDEQVALFFLPCCILPCRILYFTID